MRIVISRELALFTYITQTAGGSDVLSTSDTPPLHAMNATVIWAVMPSSLVAIYRCPEVHAASLFITEE
jgi:hypothetical protein